MLSRLQHERMLVRGPVIEDEVQPEDGGIILTHLFIEGDQLEAPDVTPLAIGDLAGTGVDDGDEAGLGVSPRPVNHATLLLSAPLVHGPYRRTTPVGQFIPEQQDRLLRVLNSVLISGQDGPPFERIGGVWTADEGLRLLATEPQPFEHLVDAGQTAPGQPTHYPTHVGQSPAGDVNPVLAGRLVQHMGDGLAGLRRRQRGKKPACAPAPDESPARPPPRPGSG